MMTYCYNIIARNTQEGDHVPIDVLRKQMSSCLAAINWCGNFLLVFSCPFSLSPADTRFLVAVGLQLLPDQGHFCVLDPP